jgi:hypothetical protein
MYVILRGHGQRQIKKELPSVDIVIEPTKT